MLSSRYLDRSRQRGALVGILLVVGLAACDQGSTADRETRVLATRSAGGPVSATDDAGRRVELASPAHRVVALLPAANEIIAAFGGIDRLVARTDYDDDPALRHLPTVGGGLTPNLERIAQLQPDLVIAWEEAGGARVRPRLQALGIDVFALATRDTADIFSTIERLGILLGMATQADSLATAMRADLAELQATPLPSPRPTVLYLVSLDPPMVASPNLFIGQMVEAAGGANAFPEVTAGSPMMSLEEIVARRPEVVLIPSPLDSATVVRQLTASAGWRELLERQGARIGILPPDILHRPGPSIVEAARTLRAVIHPGTPPAS